jgi:iron complex outermembrane recepter protein
MRSKVQRSWLLATAAAAAFPGVAWAQADDTAGSGLADIVVTATRSETNLQDTPIAITAFDSKTLEDKSIRSLQDVATFTPNLSIAGRAGGGGVAGSVAIRGMGVDSTNSQAAVGTYVDDVYFAASRGNILGLLDVDRIEVLRGPQGTLFGRNTIGGAIQYVTKNPGKELGGYLSGAFGNQKLREIEGSINLPVGDTLAVRVAAKYDERGGYVRDLLNGIDRGAEKSWGIRGKIRWTPTDSLTVDIKAEYNHMETNGHAVLVDSINPNAQFIALGTAFGETRPFTNAYLSSNFHPGDYASAGFDAPDFFRNTGYVLQGVIQYDLSDDLTFKSITAKTWDRNSLAWDADLSPLSFLAVRSPNDRTETFSQELQLLGKAADDRLDYTLGVYYFDNSSIQSPGNGLVLGLVDTGFVYGNPASERKAIAGYAQVGYKLTDSLTTTVGLRYSHEKVTGYLDGVTNATPGKVTFNDWSPYFGVNLNITPDIMLYAKASKGFRAGGFTPALQFIGTFDGGNMPFDPETAWTYEIGARMEFMDKRIRINPTFFLTDWKDIQFNAIQVVGNTPVPITDNAGDARLKGFELEAQFAVTDQLTLSGSLSLLDSHYTRVVPIFHAIFPTGWTILAGPPFIAPNSVDFVPDLTLDNELPQAPETRFTLGARYSVPLSDSSRLTANLNYSWTDRQKSAVMLTGAVEMPSHGLLNGRLEYSFANDRFSVAAYGRNLTNEYYLIGGQDFAAGYTGGSRELDPGRPREFGIELRTSF